MKKVPLIICCALLISDAHGQNRLFKILNKYMPALHPGQNPDSLRSQLITNTYFIPDSTSDKYLKGDLQHFNPSNLACGKFVVELEQDEKNSTLYTVRACFDTSLASKKIVADAIERLHADINSFFVKSLSSQSPRSASFPSKTYGYFVDSYFSPVVSSGWAYNQSQKFTGYYFFITVFFRNEKSGQGSL